MIKSVVSLIDEHSYSIWCQHFSHTPCNALCHAHKQLSSVLLLQISPFNPLCKCSAVEKILDKSFSGSLKITACPLALVHTDLVVSMLVEPCSHIHYVLSSMITCAVLCLPSCRSSEILRSTFRTWFLELRASQLIIWLLQLYLS